MRLVRDLDLNWRNFRWNEWALLTAAVWILILLPWVVAAADWRDVVFGTLILLMAVAAFVSTNRKRRAATTLPPPTRGQVALILGLAVGIAFLATIAAWLLSAG